MPIPENTLAALAGGISTLGKRLQENRNLRIARFMEEERSAREQENFLERLAKEWEYKGEAAEEAPRLAGETAGAVAGAQEPYKIAAGEREEGYRIAGEERALANLEKELGIRLPYELDKAQTLSNLALDEYEQKLKLGQEYRDPLEFMSEVIGRVGQVDLTSAAQMIPFFLEAVMKRYPDQFAITQETEEKEEKDSKFGISLSGLTDKQTAYPLHQALVDYGKSLNWREGLKRFYPFLFSKDENVIPEDEKENYIEWLNGADDTPQHRKEYLEQTGLLNKKENE